MCQLQSRQISNLKSKTHHDHSSGTSSWESDVSIRAICKSLSVNMISTIHLEDEDIDEAEEMI